MNEFFPRKEIRFEPNEYRKLGKWLVNKIYHQRIRIFNRATKLPLTECSRIIRNEILIRYLV
jgi:hypothetical protein